MVIISLLKSCPYSKSGHIPGRNNFNPMVDTHFGQYSITLPTMLGFTHSWWIPHDYPIIPLWFLSLVLHPKAWPLPPVSAGGADFRRADAAVAAAAAAFAAPRRSRELLRFRAPSWEHPWKIEIDMLNALWDSLISLSLSCIWLRLFKVRFLGSGCMFDFHVMFGSVAHFFAHKVFEI